MIIQCIKCDKSFEVRSTLIPQEGRNIQCGSCNHIWFYKYIRSTQLSNDQVDVIEDKDKKNDISEDKNINLNQDIVSNKGLINDEKDSSQLSETTNLPGVNKSSNFSLSKVLSYILVSIITCIALVIIIDTFKYPLSDIFPGLELLLYNLFETIEDMFLFIKNLLI